MGQMVDADTAYMTNWASVRSAYVCVSMQKAACKLHSGWRCIRRWSALTIRRCQAAKATNTGNVTLRAAAGCSHLFLKSGTKTDAELASYLDNFTHIPASGLFMGWV